MLTISNITNANTQISFKNFGGKANFGYDVSATYAFNLYDVTLQQDDVLLDGIGALKTAYLKQRIIARIGTDLFKKGRIVDVNIPNTTGSGDVECSLTINESVTVGDAADATFKTLIPYIYELESFDENFTFNRSGDGYSYTRTFNLKYNNNISNQFSRNSYVAIKGLLLNSRPSYGFQTDGISEKARFSKSFKPLITENYNLLDNSVSVTENFSCGFVKNYYSQKVNYTDSITEQGFKQKNYSIEVSAIKEPQEINLNNAVAEIIDELVAENATIYGKPVSIEKNISKDNNVASLNINFDTDPSKNQTNSLTYSVIKTKRDAYYDYTANLQFNSDGTNETQKYANTKSFWLLNKNIGSSKINDLFSGVGIIYEKSRSTSFNKFEGKIIETVVYTNDPAYGTFEDGILKSYTDLSVNGSVDRIYQFNHLRDRIEVYTLNGLKTITGVSIKFTVVAQKSKGIEYGLNILNARSIGIPTSNAGIESDRADINLSNGVTTRTVNYSYY